MNDFDETPREVVKRLLAASPLFKPDEGLTPEQIAARKARIDAYLARHDAAFLDMSAGAIRRRLGFSVGDPDGEDGDMGTRAA